MAKKKAVKKAGKTMYMCGECKGCGSKMGKCCGKMMKKK